jgi:hypothetical protein
MIIADYLTPHIPWSVRTRYTHVVPYYPESPHAKVSYDSLAEGGTLGRLDGLMLVSISPSCALVASTSRMPPVKVCTRQNH